jgi:hypothetical protein
LGLGSHKNLLGRGLIKFENHCTRPSGVLLHFYSVVTPKYHGDFRP